MSKPFSRKEFRRRYTALSIGSYLLILFCFAHIGYVLTSQPGTPISPDTIQAVLNHMVYRPLQLWPNQSVYLIYGAIVGLFAPLTISSSYARKKDLRQGVESGSAKWNEDLKGFCKAYTRMWAAMRPNLSGRLQSVRISALPWPRRSAGGSTLTLLPLFPRISPVSLFLSLLSWLLYLDG